MKPYFFEFEATEENPQFHFERKDCNLEFTFGMSQMYIKKITDENILFKSFIPITVHNLGICVVTFQLSAALYEDKALKGTFKYPKSLYSEGITLTPNEFWTKNISLMGDHHSTDKIMGQVQLDCEKSINNIELDKKKKTKKK